MTLNMRAAIGLIVLLTCLGAMPSSAQSKKDRYTGLPSVVWPKLYDIRFEKASDNLGEYQKPVFSEATKKLAGKTISLPGYMVPFENGTNGTHFMLSSLPLNACFFCGVGGPETVIEVFTTKAVRYAEKPIEVQGRLVLNDKNPDQLIYILKDAQVLGEAGF